MMSWSQEKFYMVFGLELKKEDFFLSFNLQYSHKGTDRDNNTIINNYILINEYVKLILTAHYKWQNYFVHVIKNIMH